MKTIDGRVRHKEDVHLYFTFSKYWLEKNFAEQDVGIKCFCYFLPDKFLIMVKKVNYGTVQCFVLTDVNIKALCLEYNHKK